jgi:MFS family permease
MNVAKRTRWIALFTLTAINLLNYIDRYIFSALLPAIKDDLKFTDTQLGLLGSAFLISYSIASPLFGWLGDRGGRSKLMAGGVGLWSLATGFSGVFTTFGGQFATRALVGLGESVYSVIAPSSIADYFSRTSRGRVFAIYSGAIPVGSALGYVIGGQLEPILGWKRAFYVVGFPGILLALILFFLPDPARGHSEREHHGESKTQEAWPLKRVYSSLFRNGGFITTVLGYAAYTFVVGGMAFWMPSYLVRYFAVSLEDANTQFGALTVAGGFIGTLLGGWWSDRIEKRAGNGFLKVSVYSMIFSVPLFLFALSLNDYFAFMAALFFLEVALFLCISPLDAAVISYVRPQARATAMALNIFLIHALGDGISRTLMGAVSDAQGLQAAILLLPWVLVIAAICWLLGLIFFFQPVPWPQGALKIARWQAHRGYRPDANVQENTLKAFRLARNAGAEMLECDVHVTKDKRAIVFHDADLKRLAGRDEKVRDLTLEDMRAKTGAPSLRELLEDSESPRLLNIELKTAARTKGEGLEEAVVRDIRETRAESRVMISSFNPYALRRIAKLAPEIPRALLVTERGNTLNKIYLRQMWLGFWSRPHALHLDDPMFTASRSDRWVERGLPLVAWTVNDLARARELFNYGVRSVISDKYFRDPPV